MAEFFNSHQKLCQGTNDKKLIHIHNLYTPKLKRKPKDCFRRVSLGMPKNCFRAVSLGTND